MSFLDWVKDSFTESQEKKRADREMMDRIRKETEMEARLVFEKEMRQKSLELAIGKAKKDAATKSGYRRFQAENRLRNLNNPKSSEGFFGKMREYTQRNIAKREQNLQRTSELKNISNNQKSSGERKRPFTPTRLQAGRSYYA